jgi:hypothetical protein
MRRLLTAIVLTLAALFATAARAQTFPATFAPLYCQRGFMVDGYRDQSGAVDDRDIVGTVDRPAGFRAIDSQFLYLRLRLDVSPMQGNGLTQFAWGFEFSTDGDPTNYEILIAVDGAAETVALYSNTTTTVPDSPADPADQLVMSYPFSQNGRVVDAGASIFGGGTDTFLDMAVPWSDLAGLGSTRRRWSPSGRRRRQIPIASTATSPVTTPAAAPAFRPSRGIRPRRLPPTGTQPAARGRPGRHRRRRQRQPARRLRCRGRARLQLRRRRWW